MLLGLDDRAGSFSYPQQALVTSRWPPLGLQGAACLHPDRTGSVRAAPAVHSPHLQRYVLHSAALPACSPFCAGLPLQAEAQPLAQEELPQGGQGYSVNRKWGCISFTSSNPWTRAGGLWPCTPWFTNTQLAHRTGWSSSPSKNTCTWLYTDVFILDFM